MYANPEQSKIPGNNAMALKLLEEAANGTFTMVLEIFLTQNFFF